MSSDFGLRPPNTPWVCPNDRQLALRAKLKSGWSLKTNELNRYPKPQKINEKEHEVIVNVIKRAEELELDEQHRVGKLVESLSKLKGVANGNGITQCVLCSESFPFSLFGKTAFTCTDCQKGVCKKCVVEVSSTKEALLTLCKLCSENREFIKKSGAWFYKSVPSYILPEKKSLKSANSSSLIPLSSHTSSSSKNGNEPPINYSSKWVGKNSVPWSQSLKSVNNGESSSGEEEEEEGKSSIVCRRKKGVGVSLSDLSSSGNRRGTYNLFIKPQKYDLSHPHSISSSNSSLHHNNSSKTSLCTRGTEGLIELSILYDDTQQALHASIHRAKDIKSTDKNGLSDPYVLLKLVPTQFKGTHLRTKTAHKTLHPVFNETLTFYGVTQNDMARQSLEINMMDEDRWGRECLGTVQVPLHRIRAQETKFLTLSLEKPSFSEEKEWGRGRLLLSLSYNNDKSSLMVGVIRAEDLPALDTNGTSDPFVKVRLLSDSALGTPSPESAHEMSRKYKTSVKWKTLNPEFHEEFSFKVSSTDLYKLALSISLWDKDIGKNNDYIGGLYLSSSSKGERLKHWSNMLHVQNAKHVVWHTLSPSLLSP